MAKEISDSSSSGDESSHSTTNNTKMVGEIVVNFDEIALKFYCHEEGLKIQAAKDIRILTKTCAKNRSRFAKHGVIEPLVSMLSLSSMDAQESALLALLNLAVKNERNKVEIVKAGAIKPLVALLSQKNAINEYAAAAMLTLSASNANKSAIGMSGAIPLLAEILKSGGQQARFDALMALYNLSTNPSNLQKILDTEPVTPLVSLLKESNKSSKLAEKISALLDSLSSCEDIGNTIANEKGGILALVEVIEDGTPQGREHSVGVLLSMCERNRKKYRDAILEEGIVPGLLELSIEGTSKAQEKARALLPLLRETANSTTQNKSFSPSDILESLVIDIASHVDGIDKGSSETAKKLLVEMVQVSMRQLQQTALVCVPSDFSMSGNLAKLSTL